MMYIVKVKDNLVNMAHVQAIELAENTIQLTLQDNEHCYKAEYGSDELAKTAFNKLFEDLAKAQGVEGAILSGNYV